MKNTFFAIDGMSYAFRAYFAIRNLRDSKGRPTNAVFGFARILLKLMREYEPSHLVIVFDHPGKTFRDDIYPQYKGNRPETPEDLLVQFPLIDKVIEAFNIPILRVEGVEADDVLGTLAKEATDRGMEMALVSGDKDILQCVTEHARVYDPHKGENGKWYGPAEVRERYGVDPQHVIDVLALMGDSSDNVPGVRGIGEKTARKLLEKYGDLDGLYEHLEELKGKQREKLEEDRELAKLSKELVTIKTDVDFEFDFDDYRVHEPDREKLADVFAELEFRTLAEEFLPEPDRQEERDYRLVVTPELLEAVVAEMFDADLFAVDTETTHTDPMRADLVGISLSSKARTGYYIPVGHADEALISHGDRVGQLPRETVFKALRPLLEGPGGKVGHNLKYDLIVLARNGLDLRNIAMDTMLASYLTDSSRLRHNLSDVSLKHLRCKLIPIADVIGKGSKAITFDKVPLDAACEYASEDADVALRLAGVFQSSLKERELESLYKEVELPLLGVLARMEMAGIAIDIEAFDTLGKEIGGRLQALETDIFELAGGPFQINSPKQLQKILFEDLGLPPKRKTKTGYSTDISVLEELTDEHPLPAKLVEYRMLDKLRGTYVLALPKLVNPETGRLHTSFNQAVAATGRLSSSEPNLQNIPVRTELGRRIRRGFVAADADTRLISADYSQIELRVLAHLTGDDALIDAFGRDLDIHRDTAARVFGVSGEDVTPEMRRQAKAVNFGVVYGISAFGLARNLGISRSEAGEFIASYFDQYPGVQEWLERTKEEGRTRGYVATVLGRRRYIPELTSSDVVVRRGAERMAINAPVQGSAADIIKVAMIRLDEALRGTQARLLLQVHDELVVEAPVSDAKEVSRTMKEIMENAFELTVPLKVDVGIGSNWEEIH